MRLSLSKVLALAAALVLLPGVEKAQAQDCAGTALLAYAYPVNPSAPGPAYAYVQCWGYYAGNNDNTQTSTILTNLFGGPVGYKSPNYEDSYGTSGWLIFPSPVFGAFGIVLKASTYWSLYKFAPIAGGAGGVYFPTTLGVAPANEHDEPHALSHYTLYTTTQIPEPATALLLGTGLLGLFGVEYRRRRKG